MSAFATVGRKGININDDDGPVVALIFGINLQLRSPGASEVLG